MPWEQDGQGAGADGRSAPTARGRRVRVAFPGLLRPAPQRPSSQETRQRQQRPSPLLAAIESLDCDRPRSQGEAGNAGGGRWGCRTAPPLEHISGAGMGVLAQARFPSSVLKCTGHLGVFGDSDEIPREGVSWRPRQGAPPQFSCFHLPPPAPRVSAFFPNVCGLLGPTDGYAHRQLPRDAPPRPGCTHGFRTRAGSSIPVPGGHVPGLLSQNPPLTPQATARRERHLSEAGTWNAVGRGIPLSQGLKRVSQRSH